MKPGGRQKVSDHRVSVAKELEQARLLIVNAPVEEPVRNVRVRKHANLPAQHERSAT